MTTVRYPNSCMTKLKLIPGYGIDAKGAVADAKLALKSDADYAKAYGFFFLILEFLLTWNSTFTRYIRLSRAGCDQAQQAITETLRHLQLENPSQTT